MTCLPWAYPDGRRATDSGRRRGRGVQGARFHGLATGLDLPDVLRLLGSLVASLRHADRGVVPTEPTDLDTGRLSRMFYDLSPAELHDPITGSRAALDLGR
ncbi:hypothetical protein [Embleya sp. AB8]|uniref:hypothetical protein n=1 Tax=Embleya sp. AB8 TaxID=3156304 RepID=UPI003C75D609